MDCRTFWLKLLPALLLAVATACFEPAPEPSSDPAPAAEIETSELLSEVHDAFLRELAAAATSNAGGPARLSAFDARCPDPFGGGALGRYLDAAAADRIPEARAELVRIHAQLECVSAARFRDVQLALQAALRAQGADLPDAVRSEGDQILAPVMFLLFDAASAPLRLDLYPWIVSKLTAHLGDLRGADSLVRRIGLWAPARGGLVELSADEIERLITSLASSAWVSGRCGAHEIERIEAESAAGPIEVAFCPRDCPLMTGSEPALTVSLDDAPIPALANACDDIRARLDSLAGSTAGDAIRQCAEEHGDANRGVVGCLASRRGPQTDPFFAAASDTERIEEIDIRRQCALAQGGGVANGGYTIKTSERVAPDGSRSTRVDVEFKDADGKVTFVVTIASERDSEGKGWSIVQVENRQADTAVIVSTQHGADGTAKSTQLQVGSDGMQTEKECEAGIAACLELPPATKAGGAKQCSPLEDSCGTGCSIADQVAAEATACVALGDEPPGGIPSGPDPDVVEPDPRDPDAANRQADALARCLLAAVQPGDGEIVDQDDCRALFRCPDGNWPRGENCSCLAEQLVADSIFVNLCDRMLCDERSETCPCGGLDAGGEGRVGGVLPGPDPVPRIWLPRKF